MSISCYNCSNTISDSTYQSTHDKNRFYHNDCFKCTECSKKLKSEFSEKEGVIVCPECMLKDALVNTVVANTGDNADNVKASLSTVCNACKNTLTDSGVAIGDVIYHKNCINCHLCNTGFENGTCIERDGKFVHKSCDDKEIKPIFCEGCTEVITGEYISRADQKIFHKPCFKCDLCEGQLVSGNYCFLGGQTLCKPCVINKGYDIN